MGSTFTINSDDFEGIQNVISEYGDIGRSVINEVLHGDGAKKIQDEIMRILPYSGKIWRGKKTAARNAQPFTKREGNLEVKIFSKSTYGYLYFPDDGSNTKRHYGDQQFMRKGAENAAPDIIERCLGRLTNEFK